MRINSQLGLFVPERSIPKSHYIGGIVHHAWTEFVFGSPTVSASSSALSLLGGHSDDTGGSAFEVPMSFLGDSSRSFLVLYCAFVDGIDRGINLPLLYTLKTSFHLSQLAASIAIGISLSPWLTKPILGLITDTVPLFGYKRKPYIFGSAGLNAISLGLIAWASVHNYGGFWVPMCLMTLRTFGRAMIDAAAQGLLLEDCRIEDAHDLQSKTSVLVSRYQAAHRLGQFINVCASGYIMATSSITTIYVSMAAVHVGTMALAWASDEQPVSVAASQSSNSSIEVFGEVREKFSELNQLVGNNKAFTNVLEYAFLALSVPSYDAPIAYYFLDARHFTVWDISVVNIVQTTGSLMAPVVYAQLFQRSKYSTVMKGLTIAAIPASLMPLIITTGLATSWGMNEVAIASASAFTLTMINDLQMLPPSIIVAQLAPRGFEGTSFSLLTVVEGSGRVVSNIASATLPYIVGAVAPHYTRMTLYIVVCTLFNVGPFSAIEGFDEVGKDHQLKDSEDEIVSLPDLTLADVVRELRERDDSSVFSSDSEQSPIRQVKIKSESPSASQ